MSWVNACDSAEIGRNGDRGDRQIYVGRASLASCIDPAPHGLTWEGTDPSVNVTMSDLGSCWRKLAAQFREELDCEHSSMNVEAEI